MGGQVLTRGATIVCAHQTGVASPAAPNPRPRAWVSGQPVVTLNELYSVACSNPASPCATASWLTGALRVTSGGQPLVLTTSQSLTSAGVALVPRVFQRRVSAT